MAKKKTTKKKSATRKVKQSSTSGKHLVIVESPTKAKTVNRYLGKDYVVMASVGHVRDLPSRNPKGVKNPVPGVDLENSFEPTYDILPRKKKTVTDLKKAAKGAADVWFATDLDREGEAIAWHLAKALNVELDNAKRVVFNAITKGEITRAFEHPRSIDENRVNAQQARRILDRIVGYQVSPLLWKKVAGGLSAGRVQSVAVRLVTEREREIQAFVPDESWKITGYFAVDTAKAGELGQQWKEFVNSKDEKGKPPTLRKQNGWLNENRVIRAQLIEFNGKKFAPTIKADEKIGKLKNLKPESIKKRVEKAAEVFSDSKDNDLTADVIKTANSCGMNEPKTLVTENKEGKGPARWQRKITGKVDSSANYEIDSIETKRTSARPYAPFITSTMQQAAANRLGFRLQRAMRVAQQLYEGIDLKAKRGQTALITYMRTDSTHLSGEALSEARSYIGEQFSKDYLPDKPNFYSSSNKDAQEAHEAIRPTDVTLTPESLRSHLTDEQFKLYDLIWRRFVACQMSAAKWDATTVLLKSTQVDALFKATGRQLVFDGFYKVVGVPGGDELILPKLQEKQKLAPIDLDPAQHFSSPPPRYTEASLQKKLEQEGIGRPSTYAAIIQTIQDRKYVEPLSPRDRRMMATDLGMVVTDMLTEAFPKIMDVPYTRHMEQELDKIEEDKYDWRKMLEEFYDPFSKQLEQAHENLSHAKAVTEPAPYDCPKCGAKTMYRFGKNGRFLSCSRYPDCDYAAPIDREGKPQTPELSDILCPECGSNMTRRIGRFGPFLGCENYPTCKGIVKLDPKKGHVVLPKTPPLTTDIPCSKCEAPLYLRMSKRGLWLSCSKFPKCKGRMGFNKLDEDKQKKLEKAWKKHEKENPVKEIITTSGHKIFSDEQYIPNIIESESDTEELPPSS